MHVNLNPLLKMFDWIIMKFGSLLIIQSRNCHFILNQLSGAYT